MVCSGSGGFILCQLFLVLTFETAAFEGKGGWLLFE